MGVMYVDQYKWPYFSYDYVKKQVCIVLQPDASLELDAHMAALLGVLSNPVVNKTNTVQLIGGASIGVIAGGLHSLYVYCDVAENVPVGDTEAPLLRIVDAGGKSGEDVCRTCDRPRYVPLQKKRFDSIEIVIRNDIGEPVAFEGGKLMVTLHFRRAASPYFSI
jgi:hypothetical protein